MIRFEGECLMTTNKPRIRIVGKALTAQNSVRAYRQSPEDICLQIRLETRFAQVSLTFEEAEALAKLLIDAVRGTH
jgi:hypothetical protein